MKLCLSFALDAQGHAVSIADVPSGLDCNCTCPGCAERLVAKKGKKREYHFSHKSNSDCTLGYETSLHLAVKAVLERTKRLMLPDCYTQVILQDLQVVDEFGLRTLPELAYSYLEHDPRPVWKHQDQFDRFHPRHGYSHLRGGLVKFDRIAVEQREGKVIPDLMGYIKDKAIYIEVAVTHFVDDAKMNKLRKLDVATIELDFSDDAARALTWDELEKKLSSERKGKRWLWNKRGNTHAYVDQQLREQRMFPYLKQLAKHEATHESEFNTNGTSKMRVVLCPSYVGVTIYGELAGGSANRNFTDWMKAARAVYDKPTNQWRLTPPTEEYWLRVEAMLRNRFRIKGGAWEKRLPPGEERRINALMRGLPVLAPVDLSFRKEVDLTFRPLVGFSRPGK